jgi:hypothetical protein
LGTLAAKVKPEVKLFKIAKKRVKGKSLTFWKKGLTFEKYGLNL